MAVAPRETGQELLEEGIPLPTAEFSAPYVLFVAPTGCPVCDLWLGLPSELRYCVKVLNRLANQPAFHFLRAPWEKEKDYD